jgi:hypothetical protein
MWKTLIFRNLMAAILNGQSAASHDAITQIRLMPMLTEMHCKVLILCCRYTQLVMLSRYNTNNVYASTTVFRSL